MFLHDKKRQYTVPVDAPNPSFAKMCPECDSKDGELVAAMRYFTQGCAKSDLSRRDMLPDIATEKSSHFEMAGAAINGLLEGTKSALVDKVEGDYLGNFLGGEENYEVLAGYSSQATLGGFGAAARRFDECFVYGRVRRYDPSPRDALSFVITRAVAPQEIFGTPTRGDRSEPSTGNVAPGERFTHTNPTNLFAAKAMKAALSRNRKVCGNSIKAIRTRVETNRIFRISSRPLRVFSRRSPSIRSVK